MTKLAQIPPFRNVVSFTRRSLCATLLAALATASCSQMDPPVATSVAVEPGQPTLAALQDTVRLAAAVTDQYGDMLDDAVVTWSSSAPNVATVSGEGLVTAVANGTATVTVTAGAVSGTASVTVAQQAVSLSLDPDSLLLQGEGETVQITVDAPDANGHPIPPEDISWSSSDMAVVTVDPDGLVTVVRDGIATVTAAAGELATDATMVVITDRGALTQIYEEMGGSGWHNDDNWLTDAPMEDWYGVEVSGGRVTELNFLSNGLEGSMSLAIFRLDALTRLDLNENTDVDGALPPELFGLSNLMHLRIMNTKVSGTLGPEIADLVNLRSLRAQYASGLTGRLPVEITRITDLRTVSLYGTNTCAPDEEVFRDWIDTLDEFSSVIICDD